MKREKTNVAILSEELWQGYESRLEVHNKTKYSGNKTRGDTAYKTNQGTEVETIRNQGSHQTGDTQGRASDLKQEESYFSKLNRKFTRQKNPKTGHPSPQCDRTPPSRANS